MMRSIPTVTFLALLIPAVASAQDLPDPDPGIAAGTDVAEPAPAQGTVEVETPDGDETDDLPGLDDLLARKAQDTAATWAGPGPTRDRGYPWFEHHGYFRLRLDGYWRAHLGTDAHADPGQPGSRTVNSSGFRPPLTNNTKNTNRQEDWIGGANMRLRYEPTFHVARSLAVRAQFDVLDNIMLGSTPDFDPDRPDAPMSVFSRSQQPPSGNNFSGKDAVSVKQAYMLWTPFDPGDGKGFLLQFSGGRMARHWGLGLVENAGRDLDADFGTYVDRVNLLTRLWGIYVELGYGWVASGPSSTDAVQPFGESYDLTNSDDVSDIALAVFSAPRTDAERRKRFNDLVVRNKPVVDWGLYLVYRSQKMDVTETPDNSYYRPLSDRYDNIALESRGAWMLKPDVWIRLEWKPSSASHLRLELEAAGVFGRINNVPRYRYNPAGVTVAERYIRLADEPLDLQAWGAAFEGEYTHGAISGGLHAGMASGTDAEYLGYRDQSNYMFDPSVRSLRSFYFHPDYRVDQLLYRHGLGTVTNSWYVKPFIQYDLFEGDRDALAGRLEVMYARAFQSRATAGDDPNLGVELDVKLFYEEKGLFFAGIDWGILFPLDGMNITASYGCTPDASGNPVACHAARSARWSMSIRGRFGVMF
jgi:uncharacterized protein (TIGR04551 family)